jgi:hypothetical protein
MTHDQILAAAYRVHTQTPHLKPLDLRVLGAVIGTGNDGLPLAYVRGKPDLFGTLTAFLPAVDRLVAAGLVQRLEIDFTPSNYRGKANRPNRKEVVYVRTSKPIIDFIL